MQSDNCRCTEWKLAQSRNDNNNNNNEIARCSHAVIWGSWSVRAHPEINCDRIPIRAHAHARHPPIYPFSFLLVSPRAYFLAPLSTPLFLHTLNRLSSALSSYRGRGGGARSRSFSRSLPFVAICKAKKRQKILPRTRSKPVGGSTRSPAPLARDSLKWPLVGIAF